MEKILVSRENSGLRKSSPNIYLTRNNPALAIDTATRDPTKFSGSVLTSAIYTTMNGDPQRSKWSPKYDEPLDLPEFIFTEGFSSMDILSWGMVRKEDSTRNIFRILG